jgi:hypothetical protein
VDPVRFDETYDATCLGSLGCVTGEVTSACTCLTRPAGAELNRVGCATLVEELGHPRTAEDDFCDETAATGPPNLDCFMPGSYRPRGEVQMVTIHGIVDVFGNGGDADQILVEIYEEGADGTLGTLLGMATSSTASTCSETEDEIDNDMVIGTRDLGYYTIPNIPTETPLIVKTSGASDFWRDLYSYNIQFLNDEIDTGAAGTPCADAPAGPRVIYDARTLSRGDYDSIPLAAAVGIITSGNGALAGEIHDCDDIRVSNASVGVFPLPVALSYFNDNPSNPLPEMSRTGTSLLGLYAALDLPPGPTDVAAVGLFGGEVVSLGWYRARVFPNSVTAVTLRGLRPSQTGM